MSTQTKIIGSICVLSLALLIGGIALLAKTDPNIKGSSLDPNLVVTKSGLHWHPKLTITIKGEKQEIPANIGLGGPVEEPIHTHEEDHQNGIIHMEMAGLVTKDQTRLGNFFKIWGKQFNSNCIFDKCNGIDEKVKFSVNGREDKSFENYEMKDGDNIEIRFE